MQNKEARFPIFQERFLKERQYRELSQADFAIFLGISRPTVGFYENGERLPDALTLKKIAEKCDVTSDYLLGLSNTRKPENANIGKRLGLSDNAIQVLEMYNEYFHGELLIPTINLLIEQETPPENFGGYGEAIICDPDISEEEARNIEDKLSKEYDERYEEWETRDYITLLSSIDKFLKVNLSKDELIDITDDGQIKKQKPTSVLHRGYWSIKSVPVKTIIDKVLLMEIQEKTEKLKAKLVQSREENKQEEGEKNGNNPKEKGQL